MLEASCTVKISKASMSLSHVKEQDACNDGGCCVYNLNIFEGR